MFHIFGCGNNNKLIILYVIQSSTGVTNVYNYIWSWVSTCITVQGQVLHRIVLVSKPVTDSLVYTHACHDQYSLDLSNETGDASFKSFATSPRHGTVYNC